MGNSINTFDSFSEEEFIYINKLDMEYCKKRIDVQIKYIFSEENSRGSLTEKLESLETVKSHLYGLRDLFWFFDTDHISEMAKPILEAIETVKTEIEEEQGEEE